MNLETRLFDLTPVTASSAKQKIEQAGSLRAYAQEVVYQLSQQYPQLLKLTKKSLKRAFEDDERAKYIAGMGAVCAFDAASYFLTEPIIFTPNKLPSYIPNYGIKRIRNTDIEHFNNQTALNQSYRYNPRWFEQYLTLASPMLQNHLCYLTTFLDPDQKSPFSVGSYTLLLPIYLHVKPKNLNPLDFTAAKLSRKPFESIYPAPA